MHRYRDKFVAIYQGVKKTFPSEEQARCFETYGTLPKKIVDKPTKPKRASKSVQRRKAAQKPKKK